MFDWIAEHHAEKPWSERHVVAFTGSGISAESGIPTFRGAGGLWQGRDATQLASPEAFAADPALVWKFYNDRRSIVHRADPNPGHRALVELDGLVAHCQVVTQNVDRLHQRAGSRNVIELHGNLEEVRCTGCGQTIDRSSESLPDRPTCDDCGAWLRPCVVWFGEMLPEEALANAALAIEKSDLLMIIGTGGVVYPAAGLVRFADSQRTTVVEVNIELTPLSEFADVCLEGPAGVLLPELVDHLRGFHDS